jgi:lauroyl/myristoyl acyltransferase
MDTLLYLVVRTLVACLQAPPLSWVARFGRAAGWLAWQLDRRHRRVAMDNLAACFPEKSAAEIRAIARENFLRLGENYCCAIKTAGMTPQEIDGILEVTGSEPIFRTEPTRSRVFAVGHFGNFELYARLKPHMAGNQIVTTYRGLPQPSLNRLLGSLRARSGALFYDRRTDAAALKAALKRPGTMLGLLADQHAGNRGLRLPFFGRDCSCSVAPALFALRYDCPLFVSICYRTAPGRWRVEFGAEIPRAADGRPRTVEAMTRDVNEAFEQAIRRDPANWFWVHNRWKPLRLKSTTPSPEESGEAEEGT